MAAARTCLRSQSTTGGSRYPAVRLLGHTCCCGLGIICSICASAWRWKDVRNALFDCDPSILYAIIGCPLWAGRLSCAVIASSIESGRGFSGVSKSIPSFVPPLGRCHCQPMKRGGSMEQQQQQLEEERVRLHPRMSFQQTNCCGGAV